MVAELAGLIDQTLLAPQATTAEMDAFLQGAADIPYAALCVQPVFLERALAARRQPCTRVAVVVAFPHGALPARIKAAETRALVEAGAEEIDMVVHLGALRAKDWETVAADLEAVVSAAGNVPVKAILECAYLDEESMAVGAAVACAAGAAFVKTSTGFGPGGAKERDVALLRQAVGTRAGVKAAGGIRNLDSAMAMLAAGADRIGTSSGRAILDGLLQVDPGKMQQ
ncbi:MAG: deoxyribose-phosphate aldolase [Limnochordales bacterium]|nr:deoxyribose-phosphate aldolase [Limnochordales bacterium]